MALEIGIVTIFPDFFKSPLNESILKRAQKQGLVNIRLYNLRDFTHDRHKTVDGKPFGGGAGMLMKPEPIFECVEAIKTKANVSPWVVLLDPQGERFTQKKAGEFAQKESLLLIAGHYEGIDHRVREHLADEVISMGDFITMGGEAPAISLIEAVVRLVPGVLGNENSIKHETFHFNSLEYPQYTRPRDFRGWKVPDVLISGNHGEVEKWRKKEALKQTKKRRPDLLIAAKRRKKKAS